MTDEELVELLGRTAGGLEAIITHLKTGQHDRAIGLAEEIQQDFVEALTDEESEYVH